MRTISTDLDQVLTTGDYGVWIKVEVSYNSGSSWVELNDLHGTDWVQSLEYESGLDRDFDTAIIKCPLLVDDMTISPYVAASRPNADGVLLNAYNLVRIYTAMTPYGIEPAAADYYWVFDGRIEETGISNDVVSVRCVSLGADLTQSFIEDAKVRYGTDAGVDVEDVIQDLLTAWDPGGSTLQEAGAVRGFAITQYETRREPLHEAIKNLATQCGCRVRYKWWTGTSTFQHEFIKPDRSAAVADRTYTFDDIQPGWSIRETAINVRNRIAVRYRDRDNGDQWALETDSDAGSITKYGDRYMELVETETSQIDTSTEAANLAGYALDDLKDPTAVVTISVPYVFAYEIDDMIAITADDLHFDTNQLLATKSIRHVLAQGSRGLTTLSLEGKPKNSVGNWMRIQSVGQSRKQWTVANVDKDDSFATSGSINSNDSFGGWDQ